MPLLAFLIFTYLIGRNTNNNNPTNKNMIQEIYHKIYVSLTSKSNQLLQFTMLISIIVQNNHFTKP